MQFISPPDKIDLRKFLEEPEKFEEETEFTLVGKITHLGHSKFSGELSELLLFYTILKIESWNLPNS